MLIASARSCVHQVIGEDACPGVKQNGFPYLIRRSVECSCPGDNIPAAIEVDISGLNLGQTVLLSQLRMPQNVKLIAKVCFMPVEYVDLTSLAMALVQVHMSPLQLLPASDMGSVGCSIRSFQSARLLAKDHEKADSCLWSLKD